MNRYILVILLLVLNCCNSIVKQDLPKKEKTLNNLTTFQPDIAPDAEIELTQEVKFSNLPEIFIGAIGSIAVDGKGRVFIADTKKLTIHIFDSTAEYIESIGREGRGLGEFQAVRLLAASNDMLVAHDALHRRITIFELDSLEVDKTINLNRIDRDKVSGLEGLFVSRVHYIRENTFLVGFSTPVYEDPSHANYNLNDQYTLYYLVNNEAEVISEKVLKLYDLQSLVATVGGKQRYTAFSFMGNPLLVLSKNKIYYAESTEFLIQERKITGDYKQAFYYPVKKQPFSREEALRRQKKKYPGAYDYRASVINNAPDEQIPAFWPVLGNMLVDDENRLWVSTVTKNPEKLKWWVLDKKGKLLARFIWPKKRKIETIKKGKLYARVTNKNGINHIVRYNITMK